MRGGPSVVGSGIWKAQSVESQTVGLKIPIELFIFISCSNVSFQLISFGIRIATGLGDRPHQGNLQEGLVAGAALRERGLVALDQGRATEVGPDLGGVEGGLALLALLALALPAWRVVHTPF